MSPPQSAVLKYDEEKMPYLDMGGATLCLDREAPPEWALEKARVELRETPEIVKASVEELRQKIRGMEHLKLPLEEEYMLMFLRPTKFYTDSALKRLTSYYQMKVKYGEVFEGILPSNTRCVFEERVLSLLPRRDQHGRRVLVIEAGKKWKPSKVPLGVLFKAVQLVVLGSMKEPISQICGGVVIIDMENLPASHVMQFTPTFALMLLEYIQDCIGLRLKAVHIVNNSYVFNMLFAIFKPFIREKLRKRIFFHGKDFKSLANHIDKDILPIKYGGTALEDPASGPELSDLFEFYSKEFEMADSYGFTDGYKISK